MYECKFAIKILINEKPHEIELTRDELRNIKDYYDNFLLEERIWDKLQVEFGAENFSKFKGIVSDIAHEYRKSIGYDCSDEYSMKDAFSEYNEKIEELLQLDKFKQELQNAIEKYGEDHIDIKVGSDAVYGIYHSRNNSFEVTGKYEIGKIGTENIEAIINELRVGRCEE